MSDAEDRTLLYGAHAKAEAVARLVTRSHLVLTYAFVFASFAVPLAGGAARDDSGQPIEGERHHFALLHLLGRSMDDTSSGAFGSTESHPNSVRVGVALLRIGVWVLLLALMAATLAVTLLLTSESASSLPAWVSGGAIVVGTMLVFLGARWVQELEGQRSAPDWRLIVPLLTAAWVLVHAASVRDLRE